MFSVRKMITTKYLFLHFNLKPFLNVILKALNVYAPSVLLVVVLELNLYECMIFNDHISSEYQKYNTIRSSCRRGACDALV